MTLVANLSQIPAISPPSGQASRFDDPSSAQPHTSVQVSIFASFGISYGLATLFLCFRYFQAIKISKKVELDLVIITFAYAIALFYFGSMAKRGDGQRLGSTPLGCVLGRHYRAQKGHPPKRAGLHRLPIRDQDGHPVRAVPHQPVAGAPRRRRYHRLRHLHLHCRGLRRGRRAVRLPGRGGRGVRVGRGLVHAVLNIASDLAVVAAPIPTVHSLGLSLRQRLSVGLILALGSAVVVCSIVRLHYVVRTRRGSGWAGQRQQYQAGLLEEDLTWAEAVLGLWSVVEVNLGILCACAMRLKPHARAYLPRLGLGVLFSAPPPPGDGGWPGGADLETIGGSRWHIGPGEQPQKAGRERSGGGRDPYLLYSIQDKDDSEPKESDVSITQSMRVVA
ncbi:hypothetical protein RB597_007691 [Gaeumannomyces tritici]